MQHETKEPEINVCISGTLTKHGQLIPFDTFIASIESEGLAISGGCTEMKDYLSVTALVGLEDESPYRKEQLSAFLEKHQYTFKGEVWEEPNTDWH